MAGCSRRTAPDVCNTRCHTSPGDPLPWWGLELAEPTDIDSIVVWNRTGCCSDRLADFTVFVSSAPFADDATIAELEVDPRVASFSFAGAAGVTESFSINTTGQYVRIQKPAGPALHLAEVQVFGVPSDDGPPPLDIDFNNDPVQVDFPTVEPVVPVPVENNSIPNRVIRANEEIPEDLPGLCSTGELVLEFSSAEVGDGNIALVSAEVEVPADARVLFDQFRMSEGGGYFADFNAYLINGDGTETLVRRLRADNIVREIEVPDRTFFTSDEAGTYRFELRARDNVLGGDPEHLQRLNNFRFVVDGDETDACPDAELLRCLANGGNLFASDSVTIRGVIYAGCLLFDSPWLDLGLTIEAVQELVARGVIQLAEGITETDLYVTLDTAFSALFQVTLGCVNAFGDLIGSIGDLIAAVFELIDDPDAFLSEQYTLIRDTVNAAVMDPANFVGEALAGVIRLDLLQENPAEWIGTIGCELLIEVLLTLTGAGAAAVAARLAERVIDFLQARQRGLDGDGDGGGDGNGDGDGDGTPPRCVLRSFSGDTEVLLANGQTIDIADVQVGDLVFAHDPETGVSGPRAVTATWPHTDTLVEFEVGDATVTTTEDHEFWNVTDQAWQETQHIDPGDYLLTADGHVVEAGNLLWDTAHHAPAFDLTINGIHTYHVTAGDEDVLVHNQNCVIVTELDLQHAIDGHTRSGPDWIDGESYFFDELTDVEIEELISRADLSNRIEQPGGNFEIQIRNPDGNVGVEGARGGSGLPTDIYTVIVRGNGTLVTAFPGVPFL